MPVQCLPPRPLIDPRMAELDKLIREGRGDNPLKRREKQKKHAKHWSLKRARLERIAAEMRAKYQRVPSGGPCVDCGEPSRVAGRCRSCYRKARRAA